MATSVVLLRLYPSIQRRGDKILLFIYFLINQSTLNIYAVIPSFCCAYLNFHAIFLVTLSLFYSPICDSDCSCSIVYIDRCTVIYYLWIICWRCNAATRRGLWNSFSLCCFNTSHSRSGEKYRFFNSIQFLFVLGKRCHAKLLPMVGSIVYYLALPARKPIRSPTVTPSPFPGCVCGYIGKPNKATRVGSGISTSCVVLLTHTHMINGVKSAAANATRSKEWTP